MVIICMSHLIRGSYGTKLVLGYAVTGGMVTLVGLTTGSVEAAIMMTWAGLLALGSVTGTNTIASIVELERRAVAIADGKLDTELRSGRVDEFGTLYSAIDTMRNSLSEQIIEAETAKTEAEREKQRAEEALAEAEQAEQEATQLANAYQETAERYAQAMQQAADGDLTVRINVNTEQKAMETVGREFNNTLEEIEDTLSAVIAFAAEIKDGTNELVRQGTTAEVAVEEAVDATKRVTTDARDQHAQLEKVTEDIDNMSAAAQQIAATTTALSETSDQATAASRGARDAATEAIEEMQTIEQETAAAVEQIESLTESTEKITEIVEVINEIADQTNMLALNASIEAARAGGSNDSAGDGFAVVADEVKGLAEETRQRAEEISVMVGNVRNETADAAETVRSTRERIVRGTDTVESALSELDTIAGSVEDINDGISEINAATSNQADTVQKTAGAVDKISTLSRQSEQTTETVAQSISEQRDKFRQVLTGLDQFQANATDLVTELSVFNVNTNHRHAIERATADGGEW